MRGKEETPKKMAQAIQDNWLGQLSGVAVGAAGHGFAGYVGSSPTMATYTSASAVSG